MTAARLLVLVFLAGASCVTAVELNVPKELFNRVYSCAGEYLRLSCSNDGAPFAEYLMTSINTKIYISTSTRKYCRANSRFSAADGSLCTKDYKTGEVGEFSALGSQISTLCVNRRECFIRLPEARPLHSKQVCGGGEHHFYGVEIEYRCTAPSRSQTDFKTMKAFHSQELSPQIFRRKRRSAFRMNHNSREHGNKSWKSLETINNNVRSKETKSLETSRNHNIHDVSRDWGSGLANSKSRDKDSRDRTGGDDYHQLNGGWRKNQRVKSFTRDGRPVYSDSNLQTSDSTKTAAMATVIIATCFLLFLF